MKYIIVSYGGMFSTNPEVFLKTDSLSEAEKYFYEKCSSKNYTAVLFDVEAGRVVKTHSSSLGDQTYVNKARDLAMTFKK